ncbi:FAD-dependent oxidoreductase [Roseisolibacter sp. H3M3-2]|uniref:flavin monoamine oxidase family protein n=1 Tax=Roseisolibacter sp. H3M3-2 TaxID=3031323 RepID=UPI0023DBAF34|nr:FAD-dependent oxidoreductase [Roseisolibacter sp. H3M3-2]MDF1503719.1 FAD-dependent oxidoreductase [Roseisolibacter sp. H3M3-2]
MPHTPLLRRLVALAQDVDRASGTPADAPRAIDRRAFLAAAAVGLGAAACADPLTGIRPPRAPRAASAVGAPASVAVVGAGLAGLTCAVRLREGGVVADVYEASARLGGRCWTRRDGTFRDGQLTEHGGELIDQSHVAIRQLAQELGLPLDNVLAAEPNGTEALYWFDGAPYTYEEATRDLKAVWQPLKRDYVEAGYPTSYARSTPRGRALDAMSVAAWIEQTVPGGRASRLGQLLEVAYVIEYGAEATEQSALNLIYLLGGVGQGQLRVFGPSNEKYKVRGGNDLLVTRLAERLPQGVRTGKALVGIRRNLARWELRFADGTAQLYDRVVLALPFSILRTVDRAGAGFPAVKERAITELGMGANSKLAVQFETRRWHALGCNGDTTSDRGYQQTWEATRAQPGTRGILVDYTGGQASLAQSGKPTQTLAQQFLAQVAPVLPGLQPTPGPGGVRAAFDDWPAYPWTKGSYSYFRVGQYTAFGGAEAEAVDGCHFAGEHTSVDAQGYLEGAVESGERAAAEVLAGVAARKG